MMTTYPNHPASSMGDEFDLFEWINGVFDVVKKLDWKPNQPLNVAQYVSAFAAKTTQNEALVNVVNLSKVSQASFYLIGTNIHEMVTLKPDADPWRKQFNFNGGKLQLTNISKEEVTLEILRVDLGIKSFPNEANLRI